MLIRFVACQLAAGCIALLAACGGGGGSGSQSPLQVLLTDGDTLPDGFVVNTIESANMANDRTIALIASQAGPPVLNGAFLRRPDGDVTPILTPSTPLPEGLSLTTMRNLVMAGTGEFSFEIGTGLDDEGLFLFAGGQLHLVARTDPGSTPDGFRLLGERRIADGGAIVFASGASPCTVDSSGDQDRVTCDFRVHEGNADGLTEVGIPTELTNQTTSGVSVVMDDAGRIALGLPSRGRQSLMGTITGGQFQSLLNRGDVVPGFGVTLSAKPRAIGSNGELVVDARFDTDGDNVIDKDRVLLMSGSQAAPIAETGVPAGNKQVLGVRGNAIDGRGRVVFTVSFGEVGNTETAQSLRIWDGGAVQEIVFEGQAFGEDDEGNEIEILEIQQLRVAANGDVLFRITLGFFEEGTRRISSTQILRWVDGSLETLLRTGDKAPNGTVVELSIADVTDSGDLLMIASVNNRTTRTMLLLPRL